MSDKFYNKYNCYGEEKSDYRTTESMAKGTRARIIMFA